MEKQQAIQVLANLKQTDTLPEELMPKTEEQALSILDNWPMPYYSALQPKTLDDVFNSPSCSIAKIKKSFGENKLRAFLAKIIIDVVTFFNVGKTMNDIQAAQTADLIIDEYYFFKPDDFKLCFTRAKKGLYGKVYDRIDGQIIFDWLNSYCKDRLNEAENMSINEANLHNSYDSYRNASAVDFSKAIKIARPVR